MRRKLAAGFASSAWQIVAALPEGHGLLLAHNSVGISFATPLRSGRLAAAAYYPSETDRYKLQV